MSTPTNVIYHYWKGRHFSEALKLKMSQNFKALGISVLEKNPNWKGGKSFEEYPREFSRELRHKAKIRDNYTCRNPKCSGKSKRLVTHHIDYDKRNGDMNNLITLCSCCHSASNFNREFWQKYYSEIINNGIHKLKRTKFSIAA
jgi:hypothetical protein